MKTTTITLTAADAVRAGMCDGKCLVASERMCTCRCGGAYHGVLADQPIGTVTLAGGSIEDRAVAAVQAEATGPIPTRALSGQWRRSL